MRFRVALATLALAGCVPAAPRASALTDTVVLGAAGDIACAPPAVARAFKCQDVAVSDPFTAYDWVVPLGDTQYNAGEPANYQQVYARGWGRFLDKTLPVIGNHEVKNSPFDGAGFYGYFGSRFVSPGNDATYRTDIGAGWTFYALNSNCGVKFQVDCNGNLMGLKSYLSTLPMQPCVIVAWHAPRFSSGDHGDTTNRKLINTYNAVVARSVPIVLNGHEHSYENRKPDNGTEVFIVGTGGKSMDAPTPPNAGTEDQIDGVFGHLRVTLTPGAWETDFIDLAGNVRDHDSGTCNP